MYANASHYTQGAVVGVVANKQRQGRMYKDKSEEIGEAGKTAKRKLELSPHERYQMLTEQIGFAMHGLHGEKWTEDSFFEKVPEMGKYVHRAANALKYLYGVSPGMGGTNPMTEAQRQAAACWEGVKQGKRQARKGEKKKGDGYQFSLQSDEAKSEFMAVLEQFGVPHAGNFSDMVSSIKQRLIVMKVEVDRDYLAFMSKIGVPPK